MNLPSMTAAANNRIGIAPGTALGTSHSVATSPPGSTPEILLLIAIARMDLHPAELSVCEELLDQPLDWKYLQAMAEKHGLEPLLFFHLHQALAEKAPERICRELRDACRTIAVRNLILSAKLREISKHLTSRQIPHLSYKGPLLAEMYGNNGSLRSYRDLDFIVPQAMLGAVRDALYEIGFDDKHGFSPAQQAASFHFGFEHPFTSKAGIDLDVHWRVVQEFKSSSLDMSGIWARRRPARLLDQDVPTLSPEDLLVVLCLHAGHHGWTYLSQLCDLAQLFHTQRKFDWAIVKIHLHDSNTRRMVFVCLHLLRKHWHINLPEDIVKWMSADPHVERLAQRIEFEIWPVEQPSLTTSDLRWLIDRSAGEGLLDRVRLFAGSIFTPSIEDIALLRLPFVLSSLYAGLRAFRLTCRYLASQWQRKGKPAEVRLA